MTLNSIISKLVHYCRFLEILVDIEGFVLMSAKSVMAAYSQSYPTTYFQVGDFLGFWTWMANIFAPGIYTTNWYNGEDQNNTMHISDKVSILIGMPRIRQLRIRQGKCLVNFFFSHNFNTNINHAINTWGCVEKHLAVEA